MNNQIAINGGTATTGDTVFLVCSRSVTKAVIVGFSEKGVTYQEEGAVSTSALRDFSACYKSYLAARAKVQQGLRADLETLNTNARLTQDKIDAIQKELDGQNS